MPHDAYGNLIQPGDEVVIPGVVKRVYSTEGGQYCNCEVELKHPMPPYTEKQTLSALNTSQVEKAVVLGTASEDAGEAAYNAFFEKAGMRPLMLRWSELPPSLQTAWRAAAQAAGLFLGTIELATPAA